MRMQHVTNHTVQRSTCVKRADTRFFFFYHSAPAPPGISGIINKLKNFELVLEKNISGQVI